MSIKSDKWIRRMAEQTGMIEPFEPGQVRQSADGQKIVSYGTSSYGYDIRCARRDQSPRRHCRHAHLRHCCFRGCLPISWCSP